MSLSAVFLTAHYEGAIAADGGRRKQHVDSHSELGNGKPAL